MSDDRIVIERISAVQTHDLRRRVLRGDDPDAVVTLPGDDADDTVHLGAIEGPRVVAISTWLVAPYPEAPTVRAVQLRGMATDPARVGHGLGMRLLRAGHEHAAATHAEIVWANARLSALGFYERNGFEAVGPVFATADTGLPHQLVWAAVRT